jgi:hypothetical protein
MPDGERAERGEPTDRGAGRPVARGPIVLLVVAALAIAVALGNGTRTTATATPTDEVGVSLPSADAVSASWFCAAGTSSSGGRANETVLVASVADTTIHATVTVLAGGAAPVSKTYDVAPHALVSLPVSDVAAVPEPGVVVEIVGGRAAVSHQLAHDRDIASGPCTRRAAADWYFAAGTTAKGSQHFLELFNPFGDDAIVDVTFLTESGVQQLDDLQGLVVPRRSRLSIPVHDALPRQARVATFVHTRTGRVVAERTEIFDGTTPDNAPARVGLALALGASAPATSWFLPGLASGGGEAVTLGIANFGNRDTTVEVGEIVDDGAAAPAQPVAVPAQSVVFVDTGARVASGHGYAVVVHARDAEGPTPPVVVEALAAWPVGASPTGVAGATALAGTANRWVVVPPDLDGAQTVTVVVPGTKAAHVSMTPVAALGSGQQATRTVKPGEMGSFPLGSRSARKVPIVITSDEPVYVALPSLGTGGADLAPAVPDLTWVPTVGGTA